MQLVSVRLQLHGKWINYQPFCKVLYQIDQACNGRYMVDSTETEEDVLILDGLISMDVSIPNYIENCFNLFKNNKQNLDVNFYVMRNYPKYIQNFFNILL